jgi:hypothetical protein
VGTDTLKPKSVTNTILRDSAPVSVIGRLTNTPGSPTDIAASVDDQFLVRRANALTFGLLVDSDIPASIARDTEVIAAIAAHEGAADPHPQYLTQTEGDSRYVQSSTVLNGSATYDPPSLLTLTGATTTVTVTGAVLGDFALASFSLTLQGITVTAYVSASDTVSVRFQNDTTGTIDLASGTLKARVWKQ